MKTKLLILLVGASLLSVGCKRDIEPPTTVVDGEQVIALSSGVTLSRTANAGNRINFEQGDQIGLTAIFSRYDTQLPKWDSLCHFENAPAAFESNDESTPVVTTFGWGPAAEGGRAWNQYYPSRKRGVFLYAYYPYEPQGEATKYVAFNPEAATDSERQPKLDVTLVNGPIVGGGEDTVLRNQPDILHYAGSQTVPVSSDELLSQLNFKHTLAQIAFRVRRPVGSSACKFVSLEMRTAAKATLNLVDGSYSFDAALADKSNRRDALYTITMADTCTRIIPESDNKTTYLDILNPALQSDFNYLMVLPLTAADADLGEIVLSCDFGIGSVSDIRRFIIVTAGLMQDFKRSSLNILTLTVSLHNIELAGSIADWGEGNEMDFPAE